MRAAIALGIAAKVVLSACIAAPANSPSPSATSAPLAGSITVFAGSSLTDALRNAGDEITKTNPDAHFTFNFG